LKNLDSKSPERLAIFRSVSEEMGFKAAMCPTKEHRGKEKKPSPCYVGITALCEALCVGLQSLLGMYGRNASAVACSQGVAGDQAFESIALCMARILHGSLSCK